MAPSRRDFLALSAATLTASAWPARTPRRRDPTILLFQGDSITDAGRDRSSNASNDARALGGGYPMLIAADLGERHPERELQIYNRGVSGNTVTDLRARWAADTVALHPTVLSILIGVNDIWHTLTGSYDGTVEKYETGYNALLANTRDALPGIRLIVLEPFALRLGAVTDAWFPEFDRYRAAAKRVAQAASATFVPLHDMFQALAAKTPAMHWSADGVHPTLAGHAAIARQWLEVVTI